MKQPILSICVVTMNRAGQLEEALKSCLDCVLPEETEFLVIDNASTDNTEEVVKLIMANANYTWYYEKMPENLGCGKGRNYAYKKSNGKYVYMLDDDAVISPQHTDRFFLDAIDIFECHADIVTLTTQIYDTAWKDNRISTELPKYSEGIYKCKMFCGGSHFLRKSFFVDPPYLPNKYGYEEIPASLRAMDKRKINAFCPSLLIIHRPMINKWDRNDIKNQELVIREIALQYAIKKMMYPVVFLPILKLATQKRIDDHLKNIENADTKVKEEIKGFCQEHPIEDRIGFSTVCRMFIDFKLSVF